MNLLWRIKFLRKVFRKKHLRVRLFQLKIARTTTTSLPAITGVMAIIAVFLKRFNCSKRRKSKKK